MTAEARQAQLAAVADSMEGADPAAPAVVGTVFRPLANFGAFTQWASNPTRKRTVKRQNTTGRPLLVTCPIGVIANPGQNGHCYLEIAGPVAVVTDEPPDENFVPVSEVGCRNNQATGTGGAGFTGGTPNIAPSGTLVGIIPIDGWYRLSTEQIANYNEPTWAYIGAPAFQIL